jgi:hypothetical protein
MVATYLTICAEHCGTSRADRSSPFRCVGATTGLRVQSAAAGLGRNVEPARPPGRACFGGALLQRTNRTDGRDVRAPGRPRRPGRSLVLPLPADRAFLSPRAGLASSWCQLPFGAPVAVDVPYHWILSCSCRRSRARPGDLPEQKAGSCGQNRRRCSLWSVPVVFVCSGRAAGGVSANRP